MNHMRVGKRSAGMVGFGTNVSAVPPNASGLAFLRRTVKRPDLNLPPRFRKGKTAARVNLAMRIFQGLAERQQTESAAKIAEASMLDARTVKVIAEEFRKATESQENPDGIMILNGQKKGPIKPKKQRKKEQLPWQKYAGMKR